MYISPRGDRSSEIAILLHALRHQTCQDFDVCILDDAYGTPLASFKYVQDVMGKLRLEGHGVQLLRNDVSFGVCKARQKLIDEDLWKENELILRLDDDQVPAPDYIARLLEVMENHEDAGIVSGVTPLLSGPLFVRQTRFVGQVANRVVLNDAGDVVVYADDCGVSYSESNVLPAHNFRSSALMKREMFDKGLCYETGLSMTGFREEAFLSTRALLMGYDIYVDLGAVAWHAPANSGGCRSNDYADRVSLDDARFKDFMKKKKDELRLVLK